MSCNGCSELKDEAHETPAGTWPCTCKKLKVGRNPDSDKCDKFNPK